MKLASQTRAALREAIITCVASAPDEGPIKTDALALAVQARLQARHPNELKDVRDAATLEVLEQAIVDYIRQSRAVVVAKAEEAADEFALAVSHGHEQLSMAGASTSLATQPAAMSARTTARVNLQRAPLLNERLLARMSGQIVQVPTGPNRFTRKKLASVTMAELGHLVAYYETQAAALDRRANHYRDLYRQMEAAGFSEEQQVSELLARASF